MQEVYLNRIATAVPQHEAHRPFLRFAERQLDGDERGRALFLRMAARGGISRRFCCFEPAGDNAGSVDAEGLFRAGAFPTTGARMQLYERYAPGLAQQAVEALEIGANTGSVTHLIVTSCTGFSAPGLDLEILRRCGLPEEGVERTLIGFMGCYAGVTALRTARHIVRSEPEARVLVVNLELCTLHLRETRELEELLTFYLWGDGCAASLVSAEPEGFRLDGFHSFRAPGTDDLMRWSIRDQGFDMVLSGRVPAAIAQVLDARRDAVLGGRRPEEMGMWAVHPGGRSVLDQVQGSLALGTRDLAAARSVLERFGNMSSATIMFVLKELMAEAEDRPLGCGMAFGPGLVTESFTFSRAA